MSRPSLVVQAMGCGMLFAVSSSVFPGCAEPEEDSIVPSAEVVDRSTQALSLGKIQSIDGSYVNCRGREGRWSLRVADGAPLDYPELSVLKNDAKCTLSLERMVADQTYDALPPIPLDTEYAATPSVLAPKAGTQSFYANARLTSSGFGASFAVTFVFSDDVALTDLKAATTAATVNGVSDTREVAAPSYAAYLDDLVIVENGKTIESAKGRLVLKELGQTGETFAIVQGSVGSTLPEVRAAYEKSKIHKLEDGIDAALLELEGAAVPAVRSIIIVHEESDVRTYQLVRVSF